MAGWTEAPPGTWTITPTIVTDTDKKERFEQIRAWINFLFFDNVEEMTDEEFVGFLITGKFSTRLSRDVFPPFTILRLWIEFKKYYVTRDIRVNTSVDNGDTEGKAVVVPAPPAP